MNYLELIRMKLSSNELIPIYTNLYDIMRSDVLQRGAVLLLQRVCVWIDTKYNMNYYELCRIKQNEYEVRWINSDLYEFNDIIRSDALQRGPVFLLQHVCVWIDTKYNIWINMNHLEIIRMNVN